MGVYSLNRQIRCIYASRYKSVKAPWGRKVMDVRSRDTLFLCTNICTRGTITLPCQFRWFAIRWQITNKLLPSLLLWHPSRRHVRSVFFSSFFSLVFERESLRCLALSRLELGEFYRGVLQAKQNGERTQRVVTLSSRDGA